MSVQNTSNELKTENAWGPTGPLVAMCAAMVLFGVFYSNNVSSDASLMAGYAFGQAAFFWVIYSLAIRAFAKVKSPFNALSFLGIWISLFVGIYASPSIPGSGSKVVDQKNVGVALSEITDTYDKFMEQAEDEQGMPTRVETLPDTTPKSTGDVGEFERFTKTVVADFVQIRNDYLLELDAIGWESILEADRLARDSGMTEGKRIVRQARDIVYKYKTKYEVRLERARGDILRLNVSESMRESLSKGFEKGLVSSKELMNKLWGMELAVVEEFGAMIDLLAANPNVWIVEDGQVFFDNDEILTRYNAHFNTIDRLVKEQVALQESNAANWKKTMNSLAK